VKFGQGGSQVTLSCFERCLSARDSERSESRSERDVWIGRGKRLRKETPIGKVRETGF
jgi:hypothetical protein